jgi:hypothetical protein
VLTHRLRNIVHNHGAVGIAIVHGSQGLVSFLTSGIPNLELDCGVLVQGNGLSKEGGADGGFAERVELILYYVSGEVASAAAITAAN